MTIPANAPEFIYTLEIENQDPDTYTSARQLLARLLEDNTFDEESIKEARFAVTESEEAAWGIIQRDDRISRASIR